MSRKAATDPELEALRRHLSEISRERSAPESQADVAELTAELDRLKALLGADDNVAPDPATGGDRAEAPEASRVSGLLSAALGKLPEFDQIMAELDKIDVKTRLREVADEIERMTLRNPLVSVTGALVLGILIGRATKGRK